MYLLTTAKVGNQLSQRVNMFDVNGSKDSLLPKIWAVEAVGIGARSNEFRQPCSARSFLNWAQSHLLLGVTFHRSGWSKPWEVGDPSYVSYGALLLGELDGGASPWRRSRSSRRCPC